MDGAQHGEAEQPLNNVYKQLYWPVAGTRSCWYTVGQAPESTVLHQLNWQKYIIFYNRFLAKPVWFWVAAIDTATDAKFIVSHTAGLIRIE